MQILESCSDVFDDAEIVSGGGIFQLLVDDELVFDTDESDSDKDAILGECVICFPCQSGLLNAAG